MSWRGGQTQSVRREAFADGLATAAVAFLAALLLMKGGPCGLLWACATAGVLIFLCYGTFMVTVALLGTLCSAALAKLGVNGPLRRKPRAFCAETAPIHYRALQPRLDLLTREGDAALWRDRTNGQLWATREFGLGPGVYTIFKPLAVFSAWQGMADRDWSVR